MDNWNSIKLGNIAVFRNGVNYDSDSFGKGIKVINVADFKDRMHPNYEKLGELDINSKWATDCFLKEGDVIFVRSNGNKNLIGRSLFIKNLPKEIKVTYSAFCIRLRFNQNIGLSPIFFLYVFKSSLFRKRMAQFGNGTNINNLNQDILTNTRVPFPPLPTQKKIANILSAYDDLIENNNQRIQLLEEMAAEIYKEWFVRFRFPGYESATFVDKEGKEVSHGTDGALPLGWERGAIGSLYTVKSGFAFQGSKLGEEGVPIIKIRNIDNYEVDTINCSRYSGEINSKVQRFELEEGNLLVAMTGATIGKVALFPRQSETYYLNQRVGKFFPKKEIKNHSFIYQFSKSKEFKENIINYSLGAAQPNISGQQIENIKLILPSNNILEKYLTIGGTFNEEIMLLRAKNETLQQTRDLLLPRLISGKLSVENLSLSDIEAARMVDS